jgi:hypothetical protein
MGNAFGPFSELWFPIILKLTYVKIQVISGAADRACRTILYSMVSGHSRLMPILLEYCGAKSPPLRKCGYEYSCIAFARWKVEVLEK